MRGEQGMNRERPAAIATAARQFLESLFDVDRYSGVVLAAFSAPPPPVCTIAAGSNQRLVTGHRSEEPRCGLPSARTSS